MALYQCIKFHLFIFNTCRDMLQTSLLLKKIRKGNNSVTTCDRVTVHALCTSSGGCLSMYQVSFNSLQYFQRYALDKHFIAKNKKGSNSVNTGDKIMIFAFCNSPFGPLSVYQVSLKYLQYFQRYAPDKSVTDGRSDGQTKRQLYALPLRSIKK